MKTYKILDTIVLGFLTHNDSYDAIISEGQLLFNGSDIVYIRPDGTHRISHTVNHAITLWVEQGKIEEITAPTPG